MTLREYRQRRGAELGWLKDERSLLLPPFNHTPQDIEEPIFLSQMRLVAMRFALHKKISVDRSYELHGCAI